MSPVVLTPAGMRPSHVPWNLLELAERMDVLAKRAGTLPYRFDVPAWVSERYEELGYGRPSYLCGHRVRCDANLPADALRLVVG